MVVHKVLHAVLVGNRVSQELEAVGPGHLPHEVLDLRKLLLLEVDHRDTL